MKNTTTSRFCALATMSCLLLLPAVAAAEGPSFVAFESAPVRPLALSPAADRLFVANTPDNRLEIFDIDPTGTLSRAGSVEVGLEPVAVAVRTPTEVWVVNHLSDSISIVELGGPAPRVKQTLLVGDEPRDIVFTQGRAFIATAHRGQHRTHASIAGVPGAGDPQVHTASIPRADVWVFDGANPGTALGGTPIAIVESFGDTPRALAVSPDGTTVYVAVFHSGNQTSVVHEAVLCNGFEDSPAGDSENGTGEARSGADPCTVGNIPASDASASPNGPADKTLPMGRPLPSRGADGALQPWTSMIVKYDGASGEWRDARGLNFSNGIRFHLPDRDVFAIDAATLVPVADYAHVGTTLFNMAVHPVTGMLYVSNTEAQNHVRFEGPGGGGSTVQGNIAHARITVIDPATGTVRPRHLNRHIDYEVLKASSSVKAHSVSTPLEMQVSPDGTRLFVAAIGSGKVAIYDTADLENDALWDGVGAEFDPTVASAHHLSVDGGPAALLLDPGHGGPAGQLYVLTRFDAQLRVLDPDHGGELQSFSLFNREPASLRAGRFMLYDAARTSSNGESSCASCHVFGDMDHLSWNLGNPDGVNTYNPLPMPTENLVTLGCDLVGPLEESCLLATYLLNGNGQIRDFSSLKGPMATQTMRGMSTHGHLHWRGDRANGYFGVDLAQTQDEKMSFKNFIVAFEGLLGMDVALPETVGAASKSDAVRALERDVDLFADFMLQVQLPPNPLRPLDRSHSPSAQVGDAFFDGARRSDGVSFDFGANGPEPDGQTCEGCHTHDPSQGFFGTDGKSAHGGEILMLKVPHFRNLYQRIGMFGLPHRRGFLPSTTDAHQGDQIRGFGFLHDGATDKLFNFLQGGVFDDSESSCSDLGGLGSHFGCGFNDGAGPVGIPDDVTRQGLVDYLLEFDTDLAPVVGQQVTLSATNGAFVGPRIELLLSRAGATFSSAVLGGSVTDCDLIAKGVVGGQRRGALYDLVSGTFRPDRAGDPVLTDAELRARALVPGQEVTYTCVPPGSGLRMGIDRDEDGVLDGDDPSVSEPTTRIAGKKLLLRDKDGAPEKRRLVLLSRDPSLSVSAAGSPVASGARLRVANPTTGEEARIELPSSHWEGLGSPEGSKGYRYKNPFGPCISAKLVPGKVLKVVCRGDGIGFGLDEPQQGSLTVTFQPGAQDAFCMSFGGTVKEKPAALGQSGLFAAKNAFAPTTCPLP